MTVRQTPKATVPPIPAPRWELTSCATGALQHRIYLLTNGWEPFAVTDVDIWFRRQVPGVTP